ncbi:MAG: tRNA (N(6)-L-threonylcarbamoyladenosine(37)-C(2))-methylthiotransferase MtaB [Terriglobales bacterium]
MSSFYVENFGCRATQADGAVIERDLLQLGLKRAEEAAGAEVVVLNTCTVTASADHDVRATIRRIHRENPGCRILVTGCYAQRAPQEIAALPGVSAVIGNSHKQHVAEIAAERIVRPSANFVPLSTIQSWNAEDAKVAEGAKGSPVEIYVGDIFAHTELMGAPVFDAGAEKTRPNLKVQDGCNNRCSFCVIPYVRGRSRSLRRDEVLREVEQLVRCGYREVVISGINLGRWGRDFEKKERFEDLLRAILEHTSLERLRISSVEPMDWSEELIRLVAESPRIAKHAHVPMQSGSDRVLRRMHRKYRPWHYAERVRKIRAAMPTAAIGADVMVGFPGETELDFEETRMMVEQLPFTYLHVFTYSSRPGTPSAEMPGQVPGPVMRERNRILREIAAEKKLAFQRSFIGSTVSAITLTVFDGTRTEALTDNYQNLWVAGHHPPNQMINVRVEGVTTDGMAGSAT